MEQDSLNKKADKLMDLVTEKDIDPAFGLFTEEPSADHLTDTADQLQQKYPRKHRLRLPSQDVQEDSV